MKKIGVLMVVSMMVLAFTGCSSKTANNLGGTKDGYGMNGYNNGYTKGNNNGYNSTYDGDMTGGYASGGAAYWDGYGVNSGRPITNSSDYGLGQDMKNVGRDIANVGTDMKNGVNQALTGNTANMAN